MVYWKGEVIDTTAYHNISSDEMKWTLPIKVEI